MRSGIEVFMEWVDELAQAQKEREALLAEVAARGLTPPEPDDTPLVVRWACAKPTDSPSYVLDNVLYRAPMQSVEPGFGDLLRRWLQMR